MTETVQGPDLQEGIPVSELANGGMIAGHVGEDAVLLARKGDEFFALDAFCTHYHGPLAEGLIVGETLHCPWHHACFEMRTGSGALSRRTDRQTDPRRALGGCRPAGTGRRPKRGRPERTLHHSALLLE
ncbi:MAG TPA: Rieske 2Fe-2S domain-containing protein, partial [Thermoanaerobaculia bacterium]|nr:Rieske 2Fe-2S domain-containing protein [Thermoanaerobaculia bacterium]